MKKFSRGDKVETKYGEGFVLYEDEESMTVVVEYGDLSRRALPRFEVKKKEE